MVLGLDELNGETGKFTIHNSQLFVILCHLMSFTVIQCHRKKLLLYVREGGRRPEGSVGECGCLEKLVSASDDDIRA